jgi:hypothetical protein
VESSGTSSDPVAATESSASTSDSTTTGGVSGGGGGGLPPDSTALEVSTSLPWNQPSPHNTTSAMAKWTISSSIDVTSQQQH